MCILNAKYLPSPDEPADTNSFIHVPATPYSKSKIINRLFPHSYIDVGIRALELQDYIGVPTKV